MTNKEKKFLVELVLLSRICITSVHLCVHSCQVLEPVCGNVFPAWDPDIAVYTEPIVLDYLLLALVTSPVLAFVTNPGKEGLFQQIALSYNDSSLKSGHHF